ncbi:MutS-related protein [Larkinella sp.]|uniref:MutS-related protein n=1 Tax=Larkinella sp. TaxID=2034517 RepID=UPI003BAA28AC
MKKPSTRTLHELQLLPQQPADKSILGLFGKTRTYGGRDALQRLLISPCNTLKEIEERQALFQFVTRYLKPLAIDVAHAYVLAAENHLISNLAWSSATGWLKRQQRAWWFSGFHPHDFNRLRGGTAAIQLVLRAIEEKIDWLSTVKPLPASLQTVFATLNTFFDDPAIRIALRDSDHAVSVLQADFILRRQKNDAVRVVFDALYQLDAYCTLARFIQTAGWVYPRFVETERAVFQVTGLVHPLLDAAVTNDFSLTAPGCLSLVTGGNMSGKTTFLKACGIAVYLAHLGLAVPAQSLQINFFDGLFTSIHLSDNLELGHSHFYSELMGIKAVADAIADHQTVFVIADELFRGTNPEDALACSRQVIDAFIRQRGSLFLVSSHLPEISATYRNNDTVQLNCFRTKIVDGKVVCNHQIEPGLAAERTGLVLLAQTGILNGL